VLEIVLISFSEWVRSPGTWLDASGGDAFLDWKLLFGEASQRGLSCRI